MRITHFLVLLLGVATAAMPKKAKMAKKAMAKKAKSKGGKTSEWAEDADFEKTPIAGYSPAWPECSQSNAWTTCDSCHCDTSGGNAFCVDFSPTTHCPPSPAPTPAPSPCLLQRWDCIQRRHWM